MCDCDYALGKDEVVEKHYSNCSSVKNAWRQSKKNADGSYNLLNKHLSDMKIDVLYHLGLDTENYDLQALFGDVKFVCLGGTKHRMREFAQYMCGLLGQSIAGKPRNITKHSQRYAMYKVGPVLSLNHGIGIPSMTIALQEVIKMLSYAKAKDPIFFRIGTSGGLGIPPGSVVVSEFGINGCLEKSYNLPVLGQLRKVPANLDERLCQEVVSLQSSEEFQTFKGGTMAADDFYMGQGRLDGPFCDYTDKDKLVFLKKLTAQGVKNIEMEVTAFAAIVNQAGLRGSVVCVTLVDRLLGDQVAISKDTSKEYQKRPMIVVGKFIMKYLQNKKLI